MNSCNKPFLHETWNIIHFPYTQICAADEGNETKVTKSESAILVHQIDFHTLETKMAVLESFTLCSHHLVMLYHGIILPNYKCAYFDKGHRRKIKMEENYVSALPKELRVFLF